MSAKASLRPIKFSLLLTILLAAGLLFSAFTPGEAASVPLISITNVVKDTSVTISGTNFPLNQTFTARMGAMGTEGVGGTIVGTFNTGSSSTFTQTFSIPAALKGAAQIAIRVDSPQGYFSYNWFINSTGGTATPSGTTTPQPTSSTGGYTGIPTFSIIKVVKGSTVTIHTNNFPAGQTFTARMGKFGTKAIGGTIVGTTASGSGGVFDVTYTIPSDLASLSVIAIRLDSPQGFFAYNWFYNADATIPVTGSTPSATATPGPTPTPVPGYSGIPLIFIESVVKDTSVTINGSNFPANQTFTVRMGAYGTKGVNGIQVATFDSGKGDKFTATYTIPSALVGSSRIAIRLETADGHFYSYNWFYNTTASN